MSLENAVFLLSYDNIYGKFNGIVVILEKHLDVTNIAVKKEFSEIQKYSDKQFKS